MIFSHITIWTLEIVLMIIWIVACLDKLLVGKVGWIDTFYNYWDIKQEWHNSTYLWSTQVCKNIHRYVYDCLLLELDIRHEIGEGNHSSVVIHVVINSITVISRISPLTGVNKCKGWSSYRTPQSDCWVHSTIVRNPSVILSGGRWPTSPNPLNTTLPSG